MIRTGIGIDSHRFCASRQLILGGTLIDHDQGLSGHSDADVVTHAVIDALLGAAGLGDIGDHFPDSDERYRGADSLELLDLVVKEIRNACYRIENIDVTVMLERPKLGPYKAEIANRLARRLKIAPDRFNLKATTGEGLGFIGRAEGAASLAIATLHKDKSDETDPHI